MSVAAVALADTAYYVSSPATPSSDAPTLGELLHELRQPLSSIEAIAYYLEMTLPDGQFEARQYMSELQRLVAHTNAILERSWVARKPCARAASVGAV